jgi:hypothetical protein
MTFIYQQQPFGIFWYVLTAFLVRGMNELLSFSIHNNRSLMDYFEKIHNFKMWSDLTLKLGQGHIWQQGQTLFKHHFSKNRLADLFHAWFK